jgi:hypothetical protein
LSSQGFNPAFVGYERGRELGQGQRGFAAFPLVRVSRAAAFAAVASWSAGRPGTAPLGTRTGAAFAGGPKSFAPRSGRAIAARRARAASISAALGAVYFAFVFGVFGRRRILLCPGRQEEFFQIEFVIR